jgi:hypothetical protein
MILDKVRQHISSPTGTGGPLILASVAYSNAYQTIAGAGGVDGDEYCYVIEEGTDSEIQRGVWSSGTNALARNTPMISIIAGVASTSKMSLAGAATIRVIIDADELSYLRGTRAITAATDTLVERAKGFMTIYNRATAIAVAIGAPSGNSFKSGWVSYMKNIGVGAVTVTAAGATITSDGTSSSAFTLNQYEQAILFSDGTNYHALIVRQPLWIAQTLTTAQKRLVQSNILIPPTVTVLSSGSGTYTTPTGCTRIRVRAIGGGGGGGSGGNTGTVASGTSGTATTFGTSLLVANGGAGGQIGTPPAGGTASLGSGPIGVAYQGTSGGGWVANNGVGIFLAGGFGGNGPFGGAGTGQPNGIGTDAVANSGSGGGGGGNTGGATPAYGSSGGAAGGNLDAIINAPASSYPYAVGPGGGGGTAGTGGFAGGAGGSGRIIIEEYYN